MAATGKTPILLYGSTTPTNAPVAGNLTNSSDGCEIAINVADKNLFFKDSTNVVNTVPIRQSSASSNGWLSSTDWTTFNNKASTSSPTFSGDVTLSTGNLVIGTSGKGIDFSATAGTGTSELLADYEEGTWTPTYTSSTGAFGTITYGLQQGTYTKVGRLVTISCYMRTNSVAAGTAGGSLQIAGLPYTPSSFIYAGTLSFSSGFYNNVNPLTISIQTDGKIYLYYRPTVTDVSTVFSAVAGTTGLNTTTTNGLNYVQFQITYQV